MKVKDKILNEFNNFPNNEKLRKNMKLFKDSSMKLGDILKDAKFLDILFNNLTNEL